MARYRGPRLKITRRLGDLPGLSRKVITRNYPPGEHGQKPKKPVSNDDDLFNLFDKKETKITIIKTVIRNTPPPGLNNQKNKKSKKVMLFRIYLRMSIYLTRL